MKKIGIFSAVAAVFVSVALFHASADAGTVCITNNFSHDVRVDISAGASTSNVTVYRGDPPRTYSSFIHKSITRITVLNLDGGASAELGSRTINAPSAATNYNVIVDSNGGVAVTDSVVNLP